MFLGVTEYNDKIYQTVLTSPTFLSISKHNTYRPHDRMNDYDTHGESQLPKEAYETLIDEEYPWNAYWGNTLTFKEIKTSDLEQDQMPENGIEEDPTDDLPF